MNELQLLTLGLVGVIGVISAVVYSRTHKLSYQLLEQKETLAKLADQLRDLVEVQISVKRRLDELATDVLQREIYQSAEDRHQHAVQDAASGMSLAELVEKHGLSSDEAALMVALHGRPLKAVASSELHSAADSGRAQVLPITGRK